MAQRGEEVIIDGESSEEEEDDAVMVITPQLRKRRRTSVIMDEDEEEEEAKSQQTRQHRPPPAGGAAHNNNNKAVSVDDEEDDDDDEVKIIHVGSASKDGSARKNRRLTILESDEEDQEPQPPSQKSPVSSTTSNSNRRNSQQLTPVTTGGLERASAATSTKSSSSSGRKSSRIEQKRQEKAAKMSIARKLQFASLDNALVGLQRQNHQEEEDDDYETEENDDDFEDEETAGNHRRQSIGIVREVEREKVHADGGEDLDEFIVGDDEVEYMEDDEEGVINVQSSSDEDEDAAGGTFNTQDDDDEVAALMATHSRDPSEWFAIYLEYLEEAILDQNLDNKLRKPRGRPEFHLYKAAICHIERQICSRRDALRVNIFWSDDIIDSLNCASTYRSSRCEPMQDCEVCNRHRHIASYHVQFGGVACNAMELYKENWMPRLRKSMKEARPVDAAFEMGSVCHARTLVYWQLLHAKQFWCILVDSKRKEVGDGNGRIAEQHREAFYKQEFGRYKRLMNLVDKFSTDNAKRTDCIVPNVWKKVTRQHLHSEFLPVVQRQSSNQHSRRGTLDSLVGESDEDENDGDDGEEEEEQEQEEKDHEVHGRQESSVRQMTPMNDEEKKPIISNDGGDVKPDVDVDDLLCLVCKENPRNGGIVHGPYMHLYCCYRCGKRQHTAKIGCLVCNRRIDRVLRLLPLTKETRKAIETQER